MTPRGKILAVQAAAVAAVVVVVYVTLLRPEGPNPITGIEAPDGAGLPRVEGREDPPEERDPADKNSRRRGPSQAGAPSGPPTAIAAAGTGLPGGAAAATQTPSGEQYADAAKALLDRVNAAPLPGQ